jgi:tetratricopeptide (TPR) repeat protein
MAEKDPEKEKTKLYNLRGSAYFRLNRYGDAAGDLQNVIRSYQADWTDYSMLGICYYNLDRIDEAIQTLEKAQSMKPGATTDALGKAYFKKGVGALFGKQYQPEKKAPWAKAQSTGTALGKRLMPKVGPEQSLETRERATIHLALAADGSGGSGGCGPCAFSKKPHCGKW